VWSTILDRLPEGWRAMRPSSDLATHSWSVTAIGPKLGGGRGAPPTTLIGKGPDELAALLDLAERLAYRRRPRHRPG
jgi:hypothetical protein